MNAIIDVLPNDKHVCFSLLRTRCDLFSLNFLIPSSKGKLGFVFR